MSDPEEPVTGHPDHRVRLGELRGATTRRAGDAAVLELHGSDASATIRVLPEWLVTLEDTVQELAAEFIATDGGEDAVFVLRGTNDTSRVYHTARDCSNIYESSNVAERPLAFVREHTDLRECKVCAGEKCEGDPGNRYHQELAKELATDGGVRSSPSASSPSVLSAEWLGPFAEFDASGEPTGEYFVECARCGAEALVDSRSTLTHCAGCPRRPGVTACE